MKRWEIHKAKVQKTKNRIKVGDIYNGIVKNITSFGIFVKFEGIVGLIHCSQYYGEGHICYGDQITRIGNKMRIVVIEKRTRGKMRLSFMNND